jgi:starch synthase (maltosyl-transferring)
MTPLIRRLQSILHDQQSGAWHRYTVPGLWVGSTSPVTFPSAPAYLLHQLSVVDGLERTQRKMNWSLDHGLVYNCFVRHITSYDHGSGVHEDGFRLTGTFPKMIGLVPYLLQLGVSTLVLMPINEVGRIGKKGTLGSPYAVKHPFHLEQTLAEPAIPMSVEDQARAFIELCHLFNIKVVTEMVLRTASIDSDLVALNPEWFYWVDEGSLQERGGTLRAPSFSAEDLATMKQKVESGDFKGLPEPDESYRQLFAATPHRVEKDEHGWRGFGPKSRTLRIPGAFADWPADDPQPAWSDVTYLRLHDHPHYRYMAYNTLRMYERELETDQYRAHTLRNTILAIIPYHVRTLNIDGAMIDMGHALPKDMRHRLLKEAKGIKQGFLLFEENFEMNKESADSGYDAAIGYLPFDAHDPEKLRSFVQRLADGPVPIRFFATPESHNTPRAVTRMADANVVMQTWLFLMMLPGAVRFLHAGMELADPTPVNTGLKFTDMEIAHYPPERLPLFSYVPLEWDAGTRTARTYAEEYRRLSSMEVFHRLHMDDAMSVIEDDERIIGFWRYGRDGRTGILVLHNTQGEPLEVELTAPSDVTFVSAQPRLDRDESTIRVELEQRETRVITFVYDATIA